MDIFQIAELIGKLSDIALVVLLAIYLTMNHGKSEERDAKTSAAFIGVIKTILDNFSDSMRDLVDGLRSHNDNITNALEGIVGLGTSLDEARKEVVSAVECQEEAIADVPEQVEERLAGRFDGLADRVADIHQQINEVGSKLATLSDELVQVETRLISAMNEQSGATYDRHPEQHSE